MLNKIWKFFILIFGCFPGTIQLNETNNYSPSHLKPLDNAENVPQIMAALYGSKKLKKLLCTGFLINEQWILSTARCYKYFTPVLAVFQSIDNKTEGISRDVAEYYPHPEFEKNELTGKLNIYDISLIKLTKTVNESGVYQIRLEQSVKDSININIKQDCFVLGYNLVTPDDENLYGQEVEVFENHERCSCYRTQSDVYCSKDEFYSDNGGCFRVYGGLLACGRKAVGLVSLYLKCLTKLPFGIDKWYCNSLHNIFYTKIRSHVPWLKNFVHISEEMFGDGLEDYNANSGGDYNDDDDDKGFKGKKKFLTEKHTGAKRPLGSNVPVSNRAISYVIFVLLAIVSFVYC